MGRKSKEIFSGKPKSPLSPYSGTGGAASLHADPAGHPVLPSRDWENPFAEYPGCA